MTAQLLRVPYDAEDDVRCSVCGYSMPPRAKKCTKCNSWTKRRWLTMTETTLSLLIALFSVLGTLGPQIAKLVFRNSDTRVSIMTGEDNKLSVGATNSGARASVVRSAYLDFPDSPLPRMSLDLPNGSPVTKPNDQSQMQFTAKTITLAKCQEQSLQNWIDHNDVELTANVQESGDDLHSTTKRNDYIAAKYLEDWIKAHVVWKKVRS